MRRLRALALVASVLLATGCSATKLAYNNLDSLASWQIGKFVDLDGPSEDIFNAGFKPLWVWHRQTQLPLYVADLRELQQAIAEPLTEEQIAAWIQRAQNHVDRLVAQALPDSARVLAALNDEQVAGLRKRMEKSRAKRAAKLTDTTPEEAQEETLGRLQSSLKRWLGSLSAEQKSLVATWVQAIQRDAEIETASGREWGAAFDALLLERTAPDLGQRLDKLLLGRELESQQAAKEIYDHNQATAVAMLARISQTLSDRQRRHFRSELEDLAQDLEQLAGERQP